MASATHKINFTRENLDSLPIPSIGRVTYHDTNKNAYGLQLRVTATGAKTFCVFRRVKGGSPERHSLGRYPMVTIEQARKQAAQIAAAMASGESLAESKRTQRAERTFSQLFAEYIERHGKPSKRTWQEDLQRYEQYLKKPLATKKLGRIDRSDLALIHSEITLAGHSAVANRVLALISSVYGWAIDAGLVKDNPAQGIRKNREVSRDRFLQGDELPRFFTALAAEENSSIRDYFQLSLLTGARRANMLAMRWEDISIERAEWRIELTKNGTPQTVTLAPQVIDILHARKSENVDGSPFVFPGKGKSGHLEDPKKGWQRLLERADLANLRIHDLRRTLGSWQAKTGSSLVIIGKSLNHKNIATTATYARLDTDPVRDSVNTAVNAMLTAGIPKAASKIATIDMAESNPAEI